MKDTEITSYTDAAEKIIKHMIDGEMSMDAKLLTVQSAILLNLAALLDRGKSS